MSQFRTLAKSFGCDTVADRLESDQKAVIFMVKYSKYSRVIDINNSISVNKYSNMRKHEKQNTINGMANYNNMSDVDR
jgi:hypothetical protein